MELKAKDIIASNFQTSDYVEYTIKKPSEWRLLENSFIWVEMKLIEAGFTKHTDNDDIAYSHSIFTKGQRNNVEGIYLGPVHFSHKELDYEDVVIKSTVAYSIELEYFRFVKGEQREWFKIFCLNETISKQ